MLKTAELLNIFVDVMHFLQDSLIDIEIFKGLVYPKMKVLSSFTHPHVIPNS